MELCEAVRREVGRWGRRGLGYFSSDSHREEEMEELRAAMRDLQLKRWEGTVSHTHAHTRIHTHTHHTHNIHTVTYMHMRTHVHTRTHTPHHTHTHARTKRHATPSHT